MIDEKFIEKLAQEMKIAGKPFHKINIYRDYFQVTCPFHKGGQERKPSLSILRVKKFDKPEGFFTCFTCNQHGTLREFVKRTLGEQKAYELVPDEGEVYYNKLNYTEEKYYYDQFSEFEIKSLPYDYDYSGKQRGISKELIEQFSIKRKGDEVLFPIKDRFGNIQYVVKRNVHNKLFYIPDGTDKTLFGLYELGDKYIPELFVAEGQYSALSLMDAGFKACATLGANFNSLQVEQLKNINTSKINICFDGDYTGYDKGSQLKEILKYQFKVKMILLPKGKDPNDLSREELKYIIIDRNGYGIN